VSGPPLVGYADRLVAAPGDRIRFMVSSERPEFTARLVRLGAGQARPAGPGFGEHPVPGAEESRHPGRVQTLHPGSYIVVEEPPALAGDTAFTACAWLWTAIPRHGEQALIAVGDAPDTGFALLIGADGDLELRLGQGDGGVQRVRTGVPLQERMWTFVACAVDPGAATATLMQYRHKHWPLVPGDGRCSEALLAPIAEPDGPLLLGASGSPAGAHLNGKLEAPMLLAGAAGPDQITALAADIAPDELGLALLAAWDFSLEPASRRVVDTGPQGRDGRGINLPMRAVTGRRFTGRTTDFREAPDEYAAIMFHDDDLADAGWEPTLELSLPAGLASGVYALRLDAGDATDHIPFAVRPSRGVAHSPVALLLPTLSHLAYANEHGSWTNPIPATPGVNEMLERVGDIDRYAAEHRLLSIYERHTDGSGVAYSSRLRPIVNLRPGYDMPLLAGPHQFGADLELVAWLDARGIDVDVITDEDLHEEGSELLSHYRVVLTGSHPEYTTLPMLDALQAWVDEGGRLMYLGGNGFYWVTSLHPEEPHVLEVRRGHAGTRVWASEPGDVHHASTGELGGLWLHRGRAPQRLAGVGFTAQGFDASLPYRLLPAARDPRVAFAMEGLPAEGEFGGHGSVLGGAAGFELDRADGELGTPPHALILATANGFSDVYQGVVEDIRTADSQQGGTVSPTVRSDIVFFETPAGGAVFSVGSIAYCGALNDDEGQNHVSRMTENVLRRFADPAPFAPPETA
jgi:N,N-dimethylformamidase